MSSLGLRRVPLSGSGWVSKEDGESDNVLAQLKSTDSKSIGVKKEDIETLFYHAAVYHKAPAFILDFVGGPLLICVRPSDLEEVAREIKTLTDSKEDQDG